jgi:hypothetical protein
VPWGWKVAGRVKTGPACLGQAAVTSVRPALASFSGRSGQTGVLAGGPSMRQAARWACPGFFPSNRGFRLGLTGWGHETWRFGDHGSRLGACPCQAAIAPAPAPGLGALQADHRHTHGMCRQERPGDQALGPFDPASTGARGPHLAAGAGLGAVSSTCAPDLRPTWFYPCRHGERATGRRRTACPAIEGLVPYSIPRTRDTWQSPWSVIPHKAPSQASRWRTMAKHGGPAGVRPRSIPWASFAGQAWFCQSLTCQSLQDPGNVAKKDPRGGRTRRWEK